MSGPSLMDDILDKIKSAIEKDRNGADKEVPEEGKEVAAGPTGLTEGDGTAKPEPSAALLQEIRSVIADGLARYRAERTIYESALGNFIVEQNPYTTWENLILPNLPVNPAGENRWVRKSGPLAENHAGDPLDPEKEIPGGDNLVFSWAVWDYLADPDDVNKTPDVPPTYVATGAAGDPLAPPESDPVRTDKIAPRFRHDYSHNIVKTIRLKYRFLDRRYKPTDALATELNVRDVHTGYVLISYSGSDGE